MRTPLKLIMILLGGVALLPASPILITTQVEASKGPSISANVGVPLKAGLELAAKKDFKGALAKAKEADGMPGKTAFDVFQINEFYAYVYANLGDYAGVARALEAGLQSGQVPPADRAKRIKVLAQSYYRTGNYSKAINYANQYTKEFGSDPDMQVLISQGYFINKDFAGAKNAAMSQIHSATAAGRKPDENSLKLLLNAAYKSNDKSTSRQAMLWLVEYYPSPAYWNDLLNLMQSQAGSDPHANLEVFRLKAATNAMRDTDDFVEAAQIAIQAGFPGDAQSFMEKGYAMKILGSSKGDRDKRLLNMAKTQAATDRASLPGTAGGSAETMAVTGEAYLSYGLTQKAITALTGAVAKGGSKQDEAQLHLGRAYLAAGNAAEARKAFSKVGGKNADLAKLWILQSQRG